MQGPHAEVPVEGLGGLSAERHGSGTSELPHDADDVVLQVDVGHGEVGQLGPPEPGVDEESEDRHVEERCAWHLSRVASTYHIESNGRTTGLALQVATHSI
jgi:hypothetical protein